MIIYKIIMGLILCFLSSLTFADSHNEAQTPDGKLRPHYQHFRDRTSHNPTVIPPQGERLFYGNPLGDKIQILPVPFILDQSEYQNVIAPGISQRARALTMFFKDVVLGSQRAFRAGGLMSLELGEHIFSDEKWDLDSLRYFWRRKKAQDISFIYGPDLVRNAQGEWVVIEDNVGPVGGGADVTATHHALARIYGSKIHQDGLPENEMKLGVENFLKAHGLKSSEVIAFLYEQSKSEIEKWPTAYDQEDLRKEKILKEMGIRVIDPTSVMSLESGIEAGNFKAIINLDDPEISTQKLWLYKNIFREKNTKLFNGPGTEVLSSKALLPFVDQMIRFYLKEEPILHTQPTELVNREWRLNAKGPVEDLVFKKADSGQGAEVYILAKMSNTEIEHFFNFIDEHLAAEFLSGGSQGIWVAQSKVDISHIPTPWARFLVDLRPITYVVGTSPETIHVAKTPWGRASPFLGDGKNNVSRGAAELVVLQENCTPLFNEIAQPSEK